MGLLMGKGNTAGSRLWNSVIQFVPSSLCCVNVTAKFFVSLSPHFMGRMKLKILTAIENNTLASLCVWLSS